MTAVQIVLGRTDYGWGVPADAVTVEGEPFAVRHTSGGDFYYSPCGKCSDWSGTIIAFGHVLGGVCFDCNGKGWRNRYESLADVQRLIKRRKSDRARRARKEAERLAVMADEHNAWMTANPDLAFRLAEIAAPWRYEVMDNATYEAQSAARDAYGGFVTDLAVMSVGRALTPAQTEAVAASLAEAEERIAAKAARGAASRHWGSVGSKVAAPGKIVVQSTYESQYGGGVLLIIEGGEGFEGVTFKVSGSGQTLWAARRGDEVTVTGTVKEHGEYEGVAQTVLTRAKIVVTKEADGS